MFILRVEENRLIFRKFVKDNTLLFYIKHKKNRISFKCKNFAKYNNFCRFDDESKEVE